MKKILLTLFITISALTVFSQEVPPFSIGEILLISSEILEEDRQINVYLPQSYREDLDKTYPVIYLLDGSADEDFIHIAGLTQFLSFPWMKKMPEVIVVGIANVDRRRDFTYPTTIERDKADFPTSGASEKFIKFIEEKLQPRIEKRYRLNGNKTLIGQSLGGLLATEILLKHPQLFDNYIIASPSLWWDDQSLLKQEPKQFSEQTKVYIAVGKEGEIMERDAKSLYEKLENRKAENLSLNFRFLEAQDHGDTLHLAVYDALEWLFKDTYK